ncbi:HAD-IA family hydrolase [Streptomyces oceani]|uniref:Hydrolase n=1 Tax=Streptomyces oceani TaxID=1075402 RepID=A0A1E7KKK6_9ACTN|nr:HAD-IA family hydrolase [Streptomyces oceani]OEV04468.1 hydrolase [Streptomyces oceani]
MRPTPVPAPVAPPLPGAVLCDLDGVLRLWDAPSMSALDRAHGLPEGTLAGAAFRPERLTPAITGLSPDTDWRTAVTGDLAAVWGAERARALTDAWSAQRGRVDGEVLRLLTDVRRRVPVVLVTNATTRLEEDLVALELADAVDAVVNSARLGAAKPDAAVYHAAAETAGVPPARCLFVDDGEANVEAAVRQGMTGHHYANAAGLRGALGGLVL